MKEEIKRVHQDKLFVVKNFEMDKVPLGEFAVYFEGKCLFSKRETGRWPKISEIMKGLDQKMGEGREHRQHSKKQQNQSQRDKEDDGLIGGEDDN